VLTKQRIITSSTKVRGFASDPDLRWPQSNEVGAISNDAVSTKDYTVSKIKII
jgi:hypothetical protein